MKFQITNEGRSLDDMLLDKERELWETNFQLMMPDWYMAPREAIELKAEKVRFTNEIRSLRKQLAKELELQKECERIIK